MSEIPSQPDEEVVVAKVGDRVEVNTKSGVRLGQVVSASGSLLRLRWDTGEETTLVPGPGVLHVIGRGRAPARARTGTTRATKRPAPKKATTRARTARTAAPARQTAAKKAAPVKKAAPAKKLVTKKAATKKSAARDAKAGGGKGGKKGKKKKRKG
jgi:hypothetical protein